MAAETSKQKRARPAVGFCGLVPRVRLARFRGAGLETSLRARALARLRRSKGIETNFVVREGFAGGAVEDGATDLQTLRRARREYVDNMLASDYILCARGAGNFSYRLYETLSCGRIPVFVDMDCVLPLDFAADWRAHCVWVDASELDEIGDRVAEFHESLSGVEFVELQRECRRFWEQYVAPEGFFARFHEHLALMDAA